MEPVRQEHLGHRIELRERQDELELLIDNVPVRYGQLPGGLYFLREYAYDWSDNLLDLARKFIDYRRRGDEIRRERASGKGGE